ncbi:hypothetical protein BVRB_3g052500 [Beta vulgaris subsp. vulgaris]|nr:hypothetical protein BVRB_3g052500 [Beta vulgaris subsp. vulgaris]
MDLNEVPSDQMVNRVKIEEKKVVNFNGVVNNELQDSRIKHTGIEEEIFAVQLEIQNKAANLEAIEGKIRVLGGEKLRVEEEIKVLRKKKAALERAVVDGEFSLDECKVESEEVFNVGELMVENKDSECEKNLIVQEVEDWKRKCKELESRVLELEGRFACEVKDGISIGIQGATSMNCDFVCAPRCFGSSSRLPGAIHVDVVRPIEDTPPDKQSVLTEDIPTNKGHVKRRLVYQIERTCNEKIAPLTQAGPRPSYSAVIDINDSDNECDVQARHRPNSLSEGMPRMMSDHGVHLTDGIMDGVHYGEEQVCDRGSAPSNMTPKTKRKRDLMVFMSDDECEDHNCTPSRRALKLENSDNEGEEVDITPIRRVPNRVTSDSENDDEDNIPISQLKRRNGVRGSNQPAGTLNSTRPRRRLVKYGQGEQKDPDTLTTENVADIDESSEDESESSVKSLSSFIVDDSDEDVEDDVMSKEDDGDDSYDPEDMSDSNLDFEDIISRLQSRRHPDSKWVLEADMLSDFGKNPELCMRAVCALYRQQTNEEKACKASLIPNGRGFSKFDATRGSFLGDFLTDGDPNGDLVKSVEELQEHDPYGVEECRKLATHYSKQLFNIYENGEDPFFP